jgi:3-oxoacyl-[acyl-carrier-protein] synthase III
MKNAPIQIPVKILGTGHSLPRRIVTDQDVDKMTDAALGTTLKSTQVHQRFWISETDSQAKVLAEFHKEP